MDDWIEDPVAHAEALMEEATETGDGLVMMQADRFHELVGALCERIGQLELMLMLVEGLAYRGRTGEDQTLS